MSLLPIAAALPTLTIALMGLATAAMDRGFLLDERRKIRRKGRDGRRGGRREADLA